MDNGIVQKIKITDGKIIDSLKKIRIKLLKTFSRIQNINSFNSKLI